MHDDYRPLPASLLAKWFVARVGQDPEQDLSNLKLQKLLYIAHSRYLHDFGRPLVSERFEAWAHGPVVEVLYRECSEFGEMPVSWNLAPDGPWTRLPTEVADTLESTWREFGGYSAVKLRKITHQVGPWSSIFKPKVKHLVIPNELIGEAWSEIWPLSEKTVRRSERQDLAETLARFEEVLSGLPVQSPKGEASFLIDELESLEDLRKHAADQLL